MIKAERDFTQVKVEKLLRHSTIHIEPMFSVTPKAFDAIQVVTPLRTASLFPDDDMLAAHTQRGISLPVIRVVETSRQSMCDDQPLKLSTSATFDGEDPDHTVALKDAK